MISAFEFTNANPNASRVLDCPQVLEVSSDQSELLNEKLGRVPAALAPSIAGLDTMPQMIWKDTARKGTSKHSACLGIEHQDINC